MIEIRSYHICMCFPEAYPKMKLCVFDSKNSYAFGNVFLILFLNLVAVTRNSGYFMLIVHKSRTFLYTLQFKSIRRYYLYSIKLLRFIHKCFIKVFSEAETRRERGRRWKSKRKILEQAFHKKPKLPHSD